MTKPSTTYSIYSKEISVMMAGVAIVMMMMLHLFHDSFAFSWVSEGVGWHSLLGRFGDYGLDMIAAFNCSVVIFAATSGYVLYANPSAYSSWKARGLRLLRFLLMYWSVEAVFLIVGVLNEDTLPTGRQLFHNMFGVATGPGQVWVNVPFAWYVLYYILFVLFVPVLLWAYQGRNICKDILVTVAICCVVQVILPKLATMVSPLQVILGAIHPLISSCFGLLFAKYAVFDKVHHLVGTKLPLWSLILTGLFVYILRHILTVINFGGGDFCLRIFMMILLVEVLVKIRSRLVQQVLGLLGRYSLYLWFLHGIFFTGKHFLQVQLYALKEPIVILLVCILVLLPIAYLLDKMVRALFSSVTR